jgi:hypothetical protein
MEFPQCFVPHLFLLKLDPVLASGTFKQNSLDWQIQQVTQRFSEWFERLLARVNSGGSGNAASQPPEWLLKAVFWFIVLGVLGWASWQLYKLLYPYWVTYRQLAQPRNQVDLPPAWQTVPEWLRQARTARQQGNYREACRALYLATLQLLSDRGVIPQEISRTDGEYLTLVQRLNLPPPYRVLIHTHERLCFDRVAISSEVYDRCWQAYQEIERS